MKTLITTLMLAGTIASADATEPFSIDRFLDAINADHGKGWTVEKIPDPTKEESIDDLVKRYTGPVVGDPRWQAVPEAVRQPIVQGCIEQAGGDYTKQADCIDRQLDGYARVKKLLPPKKD